MVTEHEIRRHHLRDAGDCSRVLVRPGLDLRLSCLDKRGLAMCRPHRARQGFAKRTTVLTAKDVDGRCGRRGRGRQRLVAEDGDRRDDDEQAGDKDPGNPTGRCSFGTPTGRCSCWFAVGHASSLGSVVLPARMWFSIRRRYAPAGSFESMRVLIVEDEPYLAEAIRDGL